MEPAIFLTFLMMLTAAGAIAQMLATRRRRRSLCNLAKQWQMHFAPWDRLKLAQRIGTKIPVLGAADVRVMDLLFRTEGSRHRYIFTVEYGVGIIRGKRRRQRIGGFDEPVHRGNPAPPVQDVNLILAPESLGRLDAYRHVWQSLAPSHLTPPHV
jgi:hypothetical protein